MFPWASPLKGLSLYMCIRFPNEQDPLLVCREKCVEMYLYQLHALLKADNYNVALLSGKVQCTCLLSIEHALYTHVSAPTNVCMSRK